MGVSLFVGGVADGQRMNVADDENNVYVAHPLPPLTYTNNIPDSFELPQVDYYRREQIHGMKLRFSVFLHEMLNPDDLIEGLIDGYRL